MPQREQSKKAQPRPSPTERRRTRRQRREARQRVKRALGLTALGLLAAVVIAGLALSGLPLRTRDATQANQGVPPGPGTVMADLGADHLAPGEKVAAGFYNSYPPTSGPHLQQPASCGASDTPIQDEVQVHNLEHGFVLLQYNTQDQAMVQELRTVAEGLPGWPFYYILAPYPNMDHAIALTAWRVVQYLDAVDADAIRAFAPAYRAQGPERDAPGC